MQIKKQLKIELNNQDVVAAIRDYMLRHGQKVSDAELADIRFVNTAKDGIRATLNVTEETDTDTDTPVAPTDPVEHAAQHIQEVGLEVVPEPVGEDQSEQPGEVETSTVEDVMPSVDEIAAMQETPVAPETTEAVAETNNPFRKSLFNSAE